MTLLCAVLTENSVLLAADTASTAYEDPTFHQPFPATLPNHDKFRVTGMPSVMWGYGGFSHVAKPIVDWASTRTWSSWDQFLVEMNEQCGKAVKRARALVKARGGRTDDPTLRLGVMAGGYIRGERGVVTIGDNGLSWRDGGGLYVPLPFGGGQTLAAVAWNVQELLHSDAARLHNKDELGKFMAGFSDYRTRVSEIAHNGRRLRIRCSVRRAR